MAIGIGYLELMVQVASVVRLEDDGEAVNLLREMDSLLGEMVEGLRLARSAHYGEVAAVTDGFKIHHIAYLEKASAVLNSMRDWQISGFKETSRQDVIDDLTALIESCQRNIEFLEEIATLMMSTKASSDDGTVEQVMSESVLRCGEELTDELMGVLRSFEQTRTTISE